MEEFLKFLQIPAVQILGWSFGIIGWIIGIFSGYLQVKGYYEQQTDREPFQYLFEQVQRDWRGQYTEQQIAELTAQFKLLEEQIRIQIPREARRVFLEDQKATIASTIASLYEQYETTNKNLDSSSDQSKLAPAIQSAIEQHIKPSYVRQQEQQNFIYRLMFIILVLLLLPISPVALLIQLAVFPLIDFFSELPPKKWRKN